MTDATMVIGDPFRTSDLHRRTWTPANPAGLMMACDVPVPDLVGVL